MPSNDAEMYSAAAGFFQRYGMPRCVGAVDSTRIEIIAPREGEGNFINRHSKHSLNVQASCDSEMLFTSVDTSQPGSAHNQFVFINSDLGLGCEFGRLGHYFLLGDSGYALRPWLLTPFLHPVDQGEVRYNRVHRTARSVIERAFGRLKMRFRCLSSSGGELQTSPMKVARIVMACCVLHNVVEKARLPLPEDAEHIDMQEEAIDNEEMQARRDNAAGARVMNALVRDVFAD